MLLLLNNIIPRLNCHVNFTNFFIKFMLQSSFKHLYSYLFWLSFSDRLFPRLIIMPRLYSHVNFTNIYKIYVAIIFQTPVRCFFLKFITLILNTLLIMISAFLCCFLKSFYRNNGNVGILCRIELLRNNVFHNTQKG